MQKNNQPLISVIIACYNGEKYLNRCFSSIEGQTYKNLQVIFVNDGSTDNSLKMIKDFCSAHQSFIVIDTPNGGVGKAKSKGLSVATGDYVTFCDCDDVFEPNHFEYLLNLALKYGAQMAVSKFSSVKSRKIDKYPTCKKYKSKELVFDSVGAMQQFFSQKLFEYILQNKLFLMDTVKKSGAKFFEGCRFGEESPFIYQFLKFADRVAYGNVPTYRYVQWKGSLMHVSFSKNRLQIYDNINLYIDDLKQNYPQVYPYLHSFRSGYSVGILYYILKSKFREGQTISEVISLLKLDCKFLKKCKKVALYKRLFIPLIPPVAKLVFCKALKQACLEEASTAK